MPWHCLADSNIDDEILGRPSREMFYWLEFLLAAYLDEKRAWSMQMRQIECILF